MVYAVYLVSFAGANEPLLLFSRSFTEKLPTRTSTLDSLCEFNAQGIETDPTELEDDTQQLLRVHEGNDVLDHILVEGKNEFLKASNQSIKKEKKKDFISGTFRIKESPVLVHWMSTVKGTALMMIVPPTANPSVVRSNLRSILSSLGSRMRIDQPREVFAKSHVISLTLKYYLPCGQLLLQPLGVTKQVDETIGKLLK